MTAWRTLMVHVDDGATAPGRIQLAARLASTLSCTLIGAAGVWMDVPYNVDLFTGDMAVDVERKRCEETLRELEVRFRSNAGDAPSIEWRGAIADPARYLHQQARAADLMVLGRVDVDAAADDRLEVTPSSVFLASGRPALIPARKAHAVHAESAVVAWADTPEARRAVQAALPLLRRSRETLVVGVGEDVPQDSLEDVVRYLDRHEIIARCEHHSAKEGCVAAQIEAAADRIAADLIVAGAYGHNRAMEWLLGGVTADLLAASERHLLLTH